MELAGGWRGHVGDDDLRRSFTQPDHDDRHWEVIEVPGHWRAADAFAGTDGPLLYRHRFEAPPPAGDRRAWLTFDGIFYQGDVWLDGAYLGDTEGYFFPHTFEVTEALRDRTEHLLAVEVACTPQHDRKAKRNITGVFQHWDCLDPHWNPGGIWRPVRLAETGPVRIARLDVACEEATDERAVVRCRARLDADRSRPALVRTTIGPVDHELRQPLAAGANELEWRVTLEAPDLWWPHQLGDQPLYDVEVSVHAGPPGGEGDDDEAGADHRLDTTGPPSDRRRVRTGLRRVQLDRWICRINGERLFLKGSNLGPTRMALATATAEELAADVHLAVDAGLDLLRVHAHITRPELYDAADEAGLLLWQDFPLQWGYARGIRKQAVRQARKAVSLLGHHPSIAIWCGHNEPMAITTTDVPTSTRELAGLALRMAAHQELPTWNKTVLDRSVKRAFEKADGTRPVVAHSGVWPHPPQLDGTDTHVYFGWYHGEARDFPAFCRALPRMARFVSEFGAQAVPESADFMAPERWPALDWGHLGERHSLQRAMFDRHVPPADHATFEEWRAATQRHQAEVIRLHVETLRRLKYRPTGGFCHFSFADAYPSVTWSVLDHRRQPKAGFDALVEACRPVVVIADPLPEAVATGDPLALDVHVVSDLRDPLTSLTCEATLSCTVDGAPWSHTWRWQGDVAADSCERVSTIQAVVPPGATGTLELALAVTAATGEQRAANRYTARISPEGGDG